MKTGAAAAVALAVVIGLVASAEVMQPPTSARLLDGGRDNVVLRAFVPSDDQPQGEVRLIRRGAAAVMQTVLYTKFLKRVVEEIRKKELASWPRDRDGHDDARRYIDAVLEARNRIQEHFQGRRNRGDRRQKMLIEFVLSDKASVVAISEPDLEEENGHMRIVSKRPIVVLALSRTYVRGDMYEIAWDALKLGKKESRELLEPLLPRQSGTDAEPPGESGQGGIAR